ncbi:mannose-1-phosphate guanylyltransferase [Algoriphagus zhangzhouensis]|uniref:Mannose-1-phosphate guanylyltransferase n=1 Tax=Algoriphagus zhangzhouensis TaxID=1073327 RepID=A0A1M7Z3D5_9BACT|nr:mannose-1-phosphate guanylyltransferase [Algoriphagus zhangzhouensis]TDY48354.1 mannose-1-phosphate guanylyltransferase [Algoriphagus zhangzhouensis]SHO59401.1 mannose-1-phosphate guanylyltransferase [Algoriphagus zhangzhouensis]
MTIVNVILSGGVGSRLWPLSRKARPKQYLPIFEGETLFQKTVNRNRKFCDTVLVVGNSGNYQLSRKDIQESGLEDFLEIIEACPRNTAAAIAFAALSCEKEDILFVTPSDHLIESNEKYASAIQRGIQLAREGNVVTFGLKPSKPETGFGYIESDGENVLAFHEKPSLEKAKEFLSQGNFFWNSGMFCFQAGVFLDELERLEPQVFEASKIAFENATEGKLDYDLSMKIPSISVDYAVMEKTKKIKVVPSEFEWSDMGSFESIYEYFETKGYPKDDCGNMVIGTDVHTEFTGLSNTLLIQTKDAILVLQKEHAQDVKKVYERLEKEKPELV